MKIKIITPLLLTTLVWACGKDSSSNKKDSDSSEARNNEVQEREEINYPADGSNIQGNYIARFTTLNSHINGTVPGSVTLSRNKDRVMVFLRLFAGYPKAWHQQKIYEGTRCPTLADDTNGDGFIDILEAEAVLGKMLIPLDADISSQRSGRNFYPLGDPSGSYYYERTTSFSRLFRDLKDIKNQTEEYKKLGPDEGFSIEGKAVLVQGVSAEVEFPETVQSQTRYKPFQTIPITCGIFESDNREPGVNDNGEIPGPIADVEEGQDRPAREGDGETEREDTGTRGERTNDAGDGNSPTVDADGRSSSEPAPRPPRDYGDENSDDSDSSSGGGRNWPWPWGNRGDSNNGGNSDSSNGSSSDSSNDSSSDSSSDSPPATENEETPEETPSPAPAEDEEA